MRVALGLGSSLGDRRRTLERALRKLDAHPHLHLVRASRWYRTPPMRGGLATGWFLNGVALFDCGLTPEALLETCRTLEVRAGRRRSKFWGDRPLDVDILLIKDLVRRDADLTVPHPGIPTRSFVLLPLLEVWPDAIDPGSGLPYRNLAPAPGPRAIPVGVVAMNARGLYG